MFKLYIPDNVHPQDSRLIKDTFAKLNLAKVRDVEFIPSYHEDVTDIDASPYGAAYVYIDYWYNNTATDNLRDRIKDLDEDARVVFDDPDYWILETCPEDTDKLFSEINKNIADSKEFLDRVNAYLHYNHACVNYLVDVNQKENKKRRAIAKRETNLKAQKRWARRLRPRSGFPRRISIFAP